MIISHAHRFIFVAVPRTGTHSVRRALRKHLAAGDEEQVLRFINRRLPYPALAGIRHGHLTLTQIRPHVGEQVFESYFKFAFVRNPFDRFVSACAFLTRVSGEFERDPRAVMWRMLDTGLDRILFAPQSRFVADGAGTLLVDAIGRVEELQAAYDRVCGRLGLATRPLERANAARRGDYREYYDEALIGAVGETYRQDCDLLGYCFQGLRGGESDV